MARSRVVVAGLGDSGVLTAIQLARHRSAVEVVGVSSKPEMLGGQELGTRLARPELWVRDNRIAYDRFHKLDGVRRLHGSLTGVDLAARTVAVRLADGSSVQEPYDVLVIATGVTNGFWRQPHLQSSEEVSADLAAAHAQLAAAGSVAVIGGGAAAVNTAAHVAGRWPGRPVDLYFPGERPLLEHHPRTWSRVEGRLRELGVTLHAGHRAVVPPGFALDALTSAPVAFSTGQPAAVAEAVVWAIGAVRPNSDWLPAELLDDDGFVRVSPTLQAPGHPEVFAIGDLAATDPLRGSARNRGDKLLAANIVAHLAGRPLGGYRPARSRWGSVLGIQPDGIWFFASSGQLVRFPAWSVDRIILPLFLRRGTYQGVRRP